MYGSRRERKIGFERRFVVVVAVHGRSFRLSAIGYQPDAEYRFWLIADS